MLTYYILSGGHHPFGSGFRCESNIFDGVYNLEHVTDVTAQDLIKWMINENPRRKTYSEAMPGPSLLLAHIKVSSVCGNVWLVASWLNWPHLAQLVLVGGGLQDCGALANQCTTGCQPPAHTLERALAC